MCHRYIDRNDIDCSQGEAHMKFFSDIGSNLRPNDGTGTACNQSDALCDEVASNLAFSSRSRLWSNSWYL